MRKLRTSFSGWCRHFASGTAGLVLSELGVLSILAVSVCAVAQAATGVPNYSVFEITLTATGTYSNPYLKMPGDSTTPGFVVGTFTGPNGETITIDGFWDGGNTWKLRMAPTSVGTWTYTTSSSDTGLNGKSGSFTATSSSSKGFIHVDPNHPHHFRWDDGTPFYWAPTATMIAHFDTRDAQGDSRRVDDGTFQALIGIRASQGFTAAHWGYFGFNKPQFVDQTQANEGGAPFINYDPTRLNPAYHKYGDQRVKALLDRGMVPQFQLGWPDQGILSSIGHTNLKRYWRYLIARYAAYNVTWNLFGEADEFGSSWESIVNDYGTLTRRFDPYRHPITTHLTGGPPSTLVGRPWYDYIMLQLGTESTSEYLAFSKPVVNAEYGGYEEFQVDAEGLRPLLWDVRMRGGYPVYESWGNDPQSAGAAYTALVNRFFRDRTKFWLLEYHPERFGGRPGLANPNQEYVVYLPAGGTVTVDLSGVSGALTAEWYNPRTGDVAPIGPVSGGGSRSFRAPDGQDWVLHLGGAATDTLPPAPPTALRAF